MTTEDFTLTLAERLEEMPRSHRNVISLEWTLPNRKRNVKVERLYTGEWAAWNAGNISGRLFSDSLDLAAAIVERS